jgi:hypothetical protein
MFADDLVEFDVEAVALPRAGFIDDVHQSQVTRRTIGKLDVVHVYFLTRM